MKNERDGLVFEKLVNAVSLIGLTTETAEYLFEHDPIALKVIDEALDLLGTPVATLRNRSIDRIIEEGHLPILGNTFLKMTQDGMGPESVEEYILDHLPSSDGSWELVFFPDNEPEPTGVNEDHANMVEIMDMIEDEFDDTHTEEEHLAEMGTGMWSSQPDSRPSSSERRSFEERRSFDHSRCRRLRFGHDRRQDFTPTHHGADTLDTYVDEEDASELRSSEWAVLDSYQRQWEAEHPERRKSGSPRRSFKSRRDPARYDFICPVDDNLRRATRDRRAAARRWVDAARRGDRNDSRRF